MSDNSTSNNAFTHHEDNTKKISLQKRIKRNVLKIAFRRRRQASFDLAHLRRILILRDDRIGDMVVTSFLFREIKRHYPGIVLDVLASQANQDVLRYNPHVNHVYAIRRKCLWDELCGAMAVGRVSYDLIVDLYYPLSTRSLLKLELLKRHSNALLTFDKGVRYGSLTVDQVGLFDYCLPHGRDRHLTEIYGEILNFLHVRNYSTDYDFFYSEQERASVAPFFASLLPDYAKIGLNIYGSSPRKSLSIATAERVIQSILHDVPRSIVIVLAPPERREEITRLLVSIGSARAVIGPVTNTILDVGATVDHLDLLVTVDTSLIHIASALRKKLVGIYIDIHHAKNWFAPKSPHFRMVCSRSEREIEHFEHHELREAILAVHALE